MNNLQSQLQQIAADFVAGALDVMRNASLSDLADPSAEAVVAEPRRTRSTPVRSQPSPVRAVRSRPEPQPAPRQEGGRRHRATAEEVQRYKDLALNTAKRMPPGFSKGDLMKRAGARIDLGRFLGLLVDEGMLVRKGERRNARYWMK